MIGNLSVGSSEECGDGKASRAGDWPRIATEGDQAGTGGVTASWSLLEPEPSRSEEGEVTREGVASDEAEGE